MKNIVLTINGKKISAPPGTSILTAAEKNGIAIPTLCSHAELAPYGACRICLVEEENSGRLMASCVTPVAPEMAIHTDSPRVKEHRKNIVRLMIAEHPESCIVCNKGNRCELRRVAAELGVAETRLYPMPNHKPFETHNPFIVRDLAKCILCGKCIRADHELVAVGAIDYSDRGFSSRPVTLLEKPLEKSRCTFCGTCVSMCPTGALSTHNTFFTGTPETEETTICGFCGAGCSLSMGVSGNRVVEINPSPDKDTVNGSTLCVRGHFAHDFLLSPERLLRPLVRETDEEGNTRLAPTGFDAALSTVAGRLADIKRRNGEESIGFIGSAKCTNEENYLFQKIARVIFGTNNITAEGAAGGHALIREVAERTKGACRVRRLSSLENADAIVAVLSDTDHTVPVAGYHIKRAVKKGAPLVVIDPYRSDLAAFGSVWLHPEKGAKSAAFGVDAINALTARLITEGGVDRAFMDQYTNDEHGWLPAISAKDPDALAKQAGIAPETVTQAASMLKGRKIAFVPPCDLLERQHGKALLDALFNLALITGAVGEKSAGIFIPALENNAVGALDMGCAPDMLPGWRKMSDAAEKELVAAMWEAAIPEGEGKDIHAMIEAAEAGTLKALYIMGENPLRSLPDPERVRGALKKLEFIVVQDILQNRTTELAHVVLPGAAFAEKQGSFTNMEGRIQSFIPIVSPPGEALPDWAILAMLARKAGYPEHYTTIEKIRQEIRRVVPSYSALGSHRQEWVKQNGSEIPNSFPLAPFHTPGAGSEPDENYPFIAYIGSRRWHLGSGTRTARSARITSSDRIGEIEIAPADAMDLGMAKGGENGGKPIIRLLSPFGAIERAAAVNPALPKGHIFVPQGFYGNDAMQIADFNALKPPGSGWRNVRVRIEKM
ncbi:MAG: molybdopterin-dependent oxidoreductase [Desulfosalsimonadaceae bacterium]